MTESHGRLVLTINSGSSSLKLALYRVDAQESLVLSGGAVRLGLSGGRLRMADSEGRVQLDREIGPADHLAAFQQLAAWLDQRYPSGTIDAVGHRLVHGGRRFTEPQLITEELMAALDELVAIDPDHTPQAVRIIKLSAAHYGLPQIACFDTAFHRHLPRFAEMYALPRHFYDEGILRYGFHGLSYEYICQELERIDPSSEAKQPFLECGDLSPISTSPGIRPDSNAALPKPGAARPVIVAHLGNGASMAAILNGRSIDTTMGFSPVSGLVMGERSGDVDPAVVVHLIAARKMTPEQVGRLINKQSGLLGVSGSSEDMQDLLAVESADPRAAEAVQLFCYAAKKYIGAYAAALGGLDTLVFTGGIGENAPVIRERICSGLEFLGINIDAGRNNSNASLVSSDDGKVAVRVIKTNEDLMIARHTARLMAAEAGRNQIETGQAPSSDLTSI
jgi:acetate kinase